MEYVDFTFEDVKQKLGLKIREIEGVFADVPPVKPSGWLEETLRRGASLALAVSTEKARSEWIIAPILLEVRSCRQGGISLFSGTSFNVDSARDLVGFCDWISARSTEQFVIEAPGGGELLEHEDVMAEIDRMLAARSVRSTRALTRCSAELRCGGALRRDAPQAPAGVLAQPVDARVRLLLRSALDSGGRCRRWQARRARAMDYP